MKRNRTREVFNMVGLATLLLLACSAALHGMFGDLPDWLAQTAELTGVLAVFVLVCWVESSGSQRKDPAPHESR